MPAQPLINVDLAHVFETETKMNDWGKPDPLEVRQV